MRQLSESSARIVSEKLSRKYIALGRIVSQWLEIVGADFAEKAQPVKLNYRKQKDGKTPDVTLDIAVSSAYATIMQYQKGVILERMGYIFGEKWITDIRFVPSATIQDNLKNKKKPPSPLTEGEKKSLSDMLDLVEDHDMKILLENLGKAIILENKT